MFLLILFLLPIIESKILLHTTQGEVFRENFTYYSLNYYGNVIMVLTTIEGDADLYISEKHLMPTYEPEKYDLHSATCGVDVVHIPDSFNRPIGVGIFGHSGYEKSSYMLEVYLNQQNEDELADTYVKNLNKEKEDEEGEPKNEKKIKSKLKSVITKSGLWAFVELFEILFL